MPDIPSDSEFIDIDDLVIEEKTMARPEPQQQMPPPKGLRSPVPGRSKSQAAPVLRQASGKRRQTIVSQRRSRRGSESALAAAVGAVLILIAVGAYLHLSPTPAPPPQMQKPIAQAPRAFKIPPQPAPVKAAEPLPTVSPQAPSADTARPRIDGPAPAPSQTIDIQASVTGFLSAWGRAWENTAGPKGVMGPYLDCYSADFSHDGMDKADWAADKGYKNRRKDWIRIRLSNIRVSTPMVDDTVSVTFFQDYSSSNFSVAGEKALLLKKSGPSWEIIGIR